MTAEDISPNAREQRIRDLIESLNGQHFKNRAMLITAAIRATIQELFPDQANQIEYVFREHFDRTMNDQGFADALRLRDRMHAGMLTSLSRGNDAAICDLETLVRGLPQ